MEELLKPVIQNGKNIKLPSLAETIDYADRQMDTLWPEYTRFLNPDAMEINLSQQLQTLKSTIIDKELGQK